MDIKQLEHELKQYDLVVYEQSVHEAMNSVYAIVRQGYEKYLLVYGKQAAAYKGTQLAEQLSLCPLSVENAEQLMRDFPWTKPVSRGDKSFTFGLGDRLGLATPGHIRALAGTDAFPIFAQQSIRELTLTNRTFPEVIASAAFAVFQEDYRTGYGADGDHLKTIEEITYALESACTMITLDSSEHIDTSANALEGEALDRAYMAVPEATRLRYELTYGDLDLPVVGVIDADDLKRIVLTFYRAIEHTKRCYAHMIGFGQAVDFEMSIDETPGVTSPEEHYVVAAELAAAKIDVSSMAPHFFGAFEKGIDYVGDLARFERELISHQAIADHFGYRLSLHSGSDKFSVFPIFGRVTGGQAHTKTAGTNWLEAVRVVSQVDPVFFRRMLAYSIEHRPEAEKYYHISSKVADIVPLDSRTDAELPLYLDEDPARQTIHITYGLLLSEPWFKEHFYRLLGEHEEAYAEALDKHIGRHLVDLGVK